ncbi:MAG: hypothetical protein ACK5DG_06475 [Chitinophagaceae bacterium]|jgi:hypothetical protein
MKASIYSYANWLAGTICPEPSFIPSNSNLGHHSFLWENFPENELKKIRSKQNEIFEFKVNDLFKKLKDKFDKEYASSKEKKHLLNNSIRKWEEILFYVAPDSLPFVSLRYSNMVFEYNQILEIRNYIKFVYELGNPVDVSFIHSSSCQFHNRKKLEVQIEAEAYYRLLSYIKQHLKKGSSPIDGEFYGKLRADFFINDEAAYLFYKLVMQTVKEKTKAADYSYIFYKMTDSQYNLIHKDTPHSFVFRYINKLFPIKLDIPQFSKTNAASKLPIFQEAYKEYLAATALKKSSA